MSNSDRYIAKTKILWKINNVTLETLKNGVNLYSSDFKVLLGPNETEWCLNFLCDDDSIYFYLHRKTFKIDDFIMNQKLEIRGSDAKTKRFYEGNENEESNKYTEDEPSWGLEIGMIQDILNEENKYLIDGHTLTLWFKLTLRTKIKPLESNVLLLNYAKLFNSIDYSDFTCISSDGKEFPVHSNILAAQSPVFDKMFKANMSESKSKSGKFNDIDGDTFLEFLRFIYTGQVENLEDIASSVIYAADKYEIIELKKLCAESLMENLSVENVLEILILADHFNEKLLLTECIELIVENYYDLKDEESWKSIEAKLMKMVMDIIIEQCREKITEFNNSLK
ncbi:hypothetical protein PVAND_006149 [Polypedilum vanderplanki]|uniref:BTB domain-containing protein n=1 Tax=Polypedilum vanderplanki TaxID=319348 RepID=A0A9J6C431_POLVA|nr:hypothetical protein PVAND_006149 [Polypedilum vanderplanki]